MFGGLIFDPDGSSKRREFTIGTLVSTKQKRNLGLPKNGGILYPNLWQFQSVLEILEG